MSTCPIPNAVPQDQWQQFQQRMQLVSAEIQKRIDQFKPSNESAARASLWVKWLNTQVLGEVK
jgi:hypothetical protein